MKRNAAIATACAVMWFAVDQGVRFIFGTVDPHGPEPEPPARLFFTLIPFIAAAIWVAWQSTGKPIKAFGGIVALTLGLQGGRIVSDFVTGWSGQAIMHDIWFGKPDYWQVWLRGFPIVLCFFFIVVAIFFLPFKYLHRIRVSQRDD